MNSFCLLYCTTYFSSHWVRNLVGDVPVLFHTIPYTPIFEPLKALYQFQEKLITANPFTHANLTIVLDISEWVEHNDEPYFDIIMEYFMDHKHWRLMYVVHDKDHRLESIVKRCFLQLQLRFIRHGELFLEPVLDASEIRNRLVQHHRMTENEASILTEIMVQSSFDRYRTVEFIDKVSAMLSSSTFNVTDLYGIPTIIFLVTPDEDSSMNKLVALMIDQIYQQLIQQYTGVYQGKNTPIRVNFIIDEFCNLSISDMANKISISRSRHLCWTLVAQSKAQLEAKYKESAATILGNCQNIIFLNSSDPTLLEYISQLSGRSSIGTSQNHPYRIQPEHLRKLKKTYEYKEAVWIRDDICYQATLPDIDQYPFAKMYAPGYYSIPIHARLPVAAYPPVQLMRDISHGVIPKPFN